MSISRARILVVAVALGAFANSLGNGFAFDDEWFIALNPVVTEARFGEAFTRAAWPGALEGTGNYRPVTLSSFAIEWQLWGSSTLAFHAVSVVAHAAVSLLVLALLLRLVPLSAALVGALFFTVHPVHTEAVANVMGRAELYAALAYLAACLLYLRRAESGLQRGVRLSGLCVLFLLALGAKEIAVTLPGVVVMLEVYRRDDRRLGERLRGEATTYVALAAVLGCYVLVRAHALGALTGSSPAPGLVSLTGTERVLTALTVWPHYVRLMVFPVDLVADYGPDVLPMTRTLTPSVVLGSVIAVGAVGLAVGLRTMAPVMAVGFAWFVVTISPVSNLLVRSDVLLAERTLYLPSVGGALVVAAIAHRVLEQGVRPRRAAAAIAFVVGTLFFARTTARNPVWLDTFTTLTTLAEQHPESWLAPKTRAIGLEGIGDHEGAAREYEAALRIASDSYQLLVDAAVFFYAHGNATRAEELLLDAIDVKPTHMEAYRRLAEQRLLSGRGREAHAAALDGLRNSLDHEVLWALLSESYVLKRDFDAAVRARRAALSRDPDSAASWRRLADLYEAMDLGGQAQEARVRAAELDAHDGGTG